MNRLILILIVIFVGFGNLSAKDYILEQQGKRILVKEHIYSDTDNLKVFKLEGTFKDNAGNFGEVNSIVNVITINNVVEKLEASNELIYNDNVKAYNTAKRANNVKYGSELVISSLPLAPININTITPPVMNKYLKNDVGIPFETP